MEKINKVSITLKNYFDEGKVSIYDEFKDDLSRDSFINAIAYAYLDLMKVQNGSKIKELDRSGEQNVPKFDDNEPIYSYYIDSTGGIFTRNCTVRRRSLKQRAVLIKMLQHISVDDKQMMLKL